MTDSKEVIAIERPGRIVEIGNTGLFKVEGFNPKNVVYASSGTNFGNLAFRHEPGNQPAVAERLRRFAQYFGNIPFVRPDLVAGNRVVRVTARDARNLQDFDSKIPQTDAVITNERGVGLFFLTGDCGPFLFSSNLDQEPAIGGAHGGLSGIINNVHLNTVEKMTKEFNLKTSDILATAEGAICGYDYIFDDEDLVPKGIIGNPRWRDYVNPGRDGKIGVDFMRLAFDELENTGVTVVRTTECTYHGSIFQGHRKTMAEGKPETRFGTAIALI